MKDQIGITDTQENRLRVYLAAVQGFAASGHHLSTDIAERAKNVVVITFAQTPRY